MTTVSLEAFGGSLVIEKSRAHARVLFVLWPTASCMQHVWVLPLFELVIQSNLYTTLGAGAY